MTKRAASGPFGTFCHHVVTKRAAVTKRAGCASDLRRFVTLVTKRAAKELRCESRGGRPAVPVPSSPYGLSGRNELATDFFGLPVFSGSVLSSLHGCFNT